MVLNEIKQPRLPICHVFERGNLTYRIGYTGSCPVQVQVRTTDSLGMEAWLPTHVAESTTFAQSSRSLQGEMLSLVLKRIAEPLPDDIILVATDSKLRALWRRSEDAWFMRVEERDSKYSEDWGPSEHASYAYQLLADVSVGHRRGELCWVAGNDVPRWPEQG